MDKITRALMLAAWAHEGQEYRPGESYFMTHIVDVWKRSLEDEADEKTQIVSILHDVLEDTSVCYNTINKEFGLYIAEELRMLDSSGYDSYEEYIDTLWGWGKEARSAKRYDLESNLESLNHPKCPENKRKNEQKYRKALELLSKNEYGEPPNE